ncbi:MAG: TonB-dependent receptor [Pseudomonadota bacterium]
MKQSLLIATAMVGISAFLIPTQVSAQSTDSGNAAEAGEEDFGNAIIVTARRREESVQDVPIIIEALTADQIEARGIANVEDIAKFTPGLVFDQGISLQDTRPVIRGLPATRGRPPVGILLDGIDISTEALGNAGGGSLVNSRLLDLERIEVIKGPQSALYGRAAFAGAINYVTKRPGDEFEGQVHGSFGSFNTWDLGGSLSVPIGPNFGVRVNVAHAQSDGDYDNPVSGDDLNSYEDTGGSVAFEFDNDDDLNVYLRVAYSEYAASQQAIQNVSGFFPGNVSRPGPTTPEGLAVQAGIDGGALVGGFGPVLPSNVPAAGELVFSGVTGLSVDPRTGEDFPGLNGDLFNATLNVTADLGPFEFIYNGGYVSQNERLIYDGDFFGLPDATFFDGTAEPTVLFDLVDFENDLELFSNEIRFQDFGSGPFRWAVGGLHWFSDTDQGSRSVRAVSGFPFTGTPPVAGFSGTSVFLGSAPNVPASPFGREIDSLSVYGLAEYDLTDSLTVSAEARYISETTQVTRSDFVQAFFAPVAPGFVNAVQREQITDDEFVPRFAITYKPNSDFLLYASVAKGFKPAGISELDFASDLADSQFLAETLWNYEIGAKTTLAGGQVTFNIAGFYMDWDDRQVTQLIEDAAAPQGFRASVQNASAAEVFGIDASVVFRPDFLPGLTWDVAYTFLDTQFTDFTILSTSAFTVTEAANCTIVELAGSPVCSVSFDGNELERAPRHQIISNVNYTADLSDDVRLILGASFQYQDERFLTFNNRLVLPSYINVDAQVGIEFNELLIQGFVTNLTQEDAVRSGQNNFDLSTFGRSVNLFAPPRRVFGVRTRFNF